MPTDLQQPGLHRIPNIGGYPDWVVPAAIVIAIIVAVVVAGFIYVRRDMAGLWVAIAGVDHRNRRLHSFRPQSPRSSFGGVTGSGTDLIVAALRQGGADVYTASLGQGLFSDPIDKLITSFIVFIILSNLSTATSPDSLWATDSCDLSPRPSAAAHLLRSTAFPPSIRRTSSRRRYGSPRHASGCPTS